MDVITLPSRQFTLGDKPTIGLEDIRTKALDDLTGTTGAITIYDSADAAVSGASGASMTVTLSARDRRGKAEFALTTGAAMIITAAGDYRAVYKITFPDGTVKHWQQKIVIQPNPMDL